MSAGFTPGPWEALGALVKAAEEAAEWIKQTRSICSFQGTFSSLPVQEDVAPGQRGVREMRKLRAAIRKAREAAAAEAARGEVTHTPIGDGR
jgi:hypothetical protein